MRLQRADADIGLNKGCGGSATAWMFNTDRLLPPFTAGLRTIAPTDISQFVRLEQCQRFLRLRLAEHAPGPSFLRDYHVAPQPIAPLVTRLGANFERRVESAVQARFPLRNLATRSPQGDRPDHNAVVVQAARALAVGEVLVLFQSRLRAQLGAWLLRGDIDILRLERNGDGGLDVLVADMKSSPSARVEHRLQGAFYLEMLAELLREAAVPVASLQLAVLYRGDAAAADTVPLSPDASATQAAEAEAALRLFGVPDAFLEIVADPESYRGSVRDLVTGPQSLAERVAEAPFEQLPYHLTYKCDPCIFTEFCMKWSAERDDLSLLPHLTDAEKTVLQRAGLRSVQEVSALKQPVPGSPAELAPVPGKEALVNQLGATWPVGLRLDELIHRARRYRRFKGDGLTALSYIPSKGYGSLPYADAQQNPNLVRIYIDAQQDCLEGRVYLLGARVVGLEDGQETPARHRSIVGLSEAPPDTADRERDLFVRFARAVVRAVVELAAPDA